MSTVSLPIKDWLEGTYTLRILEHSWDLLLKIGPFLLISLAISVAASRFMRNRQLLFSGRSEIVAVLIAACVGLVSPLPTYAAIPVALSLMSGGVPFSAVLAFVISSPLMNPGIFFLTAAELGIEMAMARTVTAFALGAAAGLCVMTIFKSLSLSCNRSVAPHCMPERSLIADIWKALRYAVRYFSIAILLSAAVKSLVPPQVVVDLLGSDARMGTLLAIGLGVPFYSCGGAAIPFMETLMNMGMSKGPMLAFFIAGPATKLETLYAFKSQCGVQVLLFYLAITFACSFIAGLVYSVI